MHGVWLLVFVPIAAIVAWRCSGPRVQRLAGYLFLFAAVSLVGWFSYLTFNGTELTASIYDRVLHSLGAIISSINLPILQFMGAMGLIVEWPKKWEFTRDHQANDELGTENFGEKLGS